MRIQVIGVSAAEVTGITDARLGALAEATDAYLAAGLLERLRQAGLEVAGVARPELPGDRVGPDPVVNLGAYNALIADVVAAGIAAGAQPLLAGGTCSHLIGMLAGLQRAYGPAAKIGLLWFDAHGDFNTPKTTLSGMLGGMPVAVAAGLCHGPWRELAGMVAALPTDRIVMVDVRNLDPAEARLVAATDVRIARFGPGGAPGEIEAAIADLAGRVDHLYLHIDADVLDASLQPNHPTAEPDGPALEPTLAAIGAAARTGKVRAVAVVSVDPTGPQGGISLRSGLAMIAGAGRAWAAATPVV